MVKNIDVHREDNTKAHTAERKTRDNEMRMKWAIGCTKHTADKVDNEGKLLESKRSPMSSYHNMTMKTDVISFKPAVIDKENQEEERARDLQVS